jgi:hypothetical protein
MRKTRPFHILVEREKASVCGIKLKDYRLIPVNNKYCKDCERVLMQRAWNGTVRIIAVK